MRLRMPEPYQTSVDPQKAGWGTSAKAPTARPIPAWGEAPGTSQTASKSANGATYTSLGQSPRYEHLTTPGLKARPIPTSIPQIPLIKLNPILSEKCAKFLFEIDPSMMVHLSIDISNQRTQIRRSNRKSPIPSLPCEPSQAGRLSLHPSGRRSLELLHQIRHTRLPRQANREMNVVRNAANPIALAFRIADNRSQIGIKVRTHDLVDQFRTIFRTENQMNEQIGERLGHRDEYRSGLQPSHSSNPGTWGCAPCWYSDAPSAL
jgi:hypothetical protein